MSSLQNLRYLDLSGNKLDTVPVGLNRLVGLETLKLNCNLISRVIAVQPLRVYQVMGNPVQLLELAVSRLNLD
jgi:Leucine-rich repeat (LRR) protein